VYNWRSWFFESVVQQIVVSVLQRYLVLRIASSPISPLRPPHRRLVSVLNDKSVYNIAFVVDVDPKVCAALW
jgi:hypothetical protein